MGGTDHLVERKQRVVDRRLCYKHIQSCTGRPLPEVRWHHNKSSSLTMPAPGAIDDHHAVFHEGQRLFIDQVPGIFQFGHMNGDIIRLLEQFFQT